MTIELRDVTMENYFDSFEFGCQGISKTIHCN